MKDHVSAVTFDVGGTLMAPWPSVGHIYSQVAERHGHHAVSPQALNRQFAAAWKNKGAFTHRRSEWQALVHQSFAGLLAAPPSGALFADLYQHFGRAAAWRVFDDVHPTLRALREAGFRLAVISNWDERLGPLLDELALSQYFRAFAISCQVGAPKPDRAIFEHARNALGVVEPNSLLHVGDTWDEDVKGAQAAGCQALLLDRQQGGQGRGGGTIGALAEVLPLLGKPLQPPDFV